MMTEKLPTIEWLEIQDKVREIIGLGMTVSEVMLMLDGVKEELELKRE